MNSIETSQLTFSLRPATDEDLPKIMEIERKSYRLPWTEQAFREEMQKPYAQVLVLSDDQTDSVIAGYIVFWLFFEECHVLNIAVHSDWRGLGFGRQMMRQARNEALRKEMKRVFLEVRKSNEAAVQLYQKEGFFIDHIKPKFYEDGEDAYFMVLYLTQTNKF